MDIWLNKLTSKKNKSDELFYDENDLVKGQLLFNIFFFFL